MNAEILISLQKETEQTKKAIAAYESSDKHNNYWSAPTKVMEAIAELGAENIFLLNEEYHGLYHDDYAYFVYFNNVTGETFKDQWTTAFACPAYQSYKCITISEAWKNGLVNADKYLQMRKNDMLSYLGEEGTPPMSVKDLIKNKVLVEVKRGRKWHGTGYVISYREMTFGYKSVTYAVIYDPKENVINEVSSEHVDIANHFELEKEWRKSCRERVQALTPDDVDASDMKIAISIDFKDWLFEKNADVNIDTSTASWPAQEARDKKQAEFKEKKMVELVEWVKNNTDKKGDEIQALAERIFNRRYA